MYTVITVKKTTYLDEKYFPLTSLSIQYSNIIKQFKNDLV